MALNGFIEILSRERVAGWVVDMEQPDVPVDFTVLAGDRVIARCLANLFRNDLLQGGHSGGYSGFDIELLPALDPRAGHVVSLRQESDGRHLPGSPRTLGAATAFAAATRDHISGILDALAPAEMPLALAFFAEHTERLRGSLSDHADGIGEERRERALRWQEPAAATRAGRRGPRARRALVIDDRMPEPGRDAGSDAIVSHACALKRLGYEVFFAPATMRGDGAILHENGIATCHFPHYATVEELVSRRRFDLVYLHRLSSAERYLGMARHHQPGAVLLYCVADLHFLRTSRQAEVQERPELLPVARAQCVAELGAACRSDAVLTHSAVEAELLRRSLPAARVAIVPWEVPLRPTEAPFADRRGAAFIAHYPHEPNGDAARTLLDRIMPLVLRGDASFPCLLAGSGQPDWLRSLAVHPVELLGQVADLDALFARVRMSVAPLAFGAGVKGKVLTSLAAGVPCVCTAVAAEGLDLPPPLDGLVADGDEAFAEIMLRLDADEAFHARCSRAGLDYIASRNDADAVDRAFREALAFADPAAAIQPPRAIRASPVVPMAASGADR